MTGARATRFLQRAEKAVGSEVTPGEVRGSGVFRAYRAFVGSLSMFRVFQTIFRACQRWTRLNRGWGFNKGVA